MTPYAEKLVVKLFRNSPDNRNTRYPTRKWYHEMAKSPSKTSEAGGEVQPRNAFQAMLSRMGKMASMDASANPYAGEDLLAILEAETEAEMWDADERGTFNAKMLSGCELEITGFEVKFGAGASDDSEISTIFIDPETGRQMYLFIYASRINNAGAKKEYNLPAVHESFTFNTSARYIVAKLMKMLDMGFFDNNGTVRVRIEGTQLAGGKKSVEKLKPIGEVTTVAADIAREKQDADAEEPPF